MRKLYRATHYIRDDEYCLNLCEVNLLTPNSKERHRYEIIVVMRDDELAEYRRDMGKVSDFKADQINIMGGVIDGKKVYMEETVGSLRDIAFVLREYPTFDKKDILGLSKWQDKKKTIFS